MDSWVPCLVAFILGVVAGIAFMVLKPILNAAQRRRSELAAARRRILAGMKEKHDEEILDEAFRTTEAIKGELDKSLQTLRRTLNATLQSTPANVGNGSKPVIHLSEPVKPQH